MEKLRVNLAQGAGVAGLVVTRMGGGWHTQPGEAHPARGRKSVRQVPLCPGETACPSVCEDTCRLDLSVLV